MTVVLAAFVGVVVVTKDSISTVSIAVDARVGEPESQVGLALYVLFAIAVGGVVLSVTALAKRSEDVQIQTQSKPTG
jgi:hypothetical protein